MKNERTRVYGWFRFCLSVMASLCALVPAGGALGQPPPPLTEESLRALIYDDNVPGFRKVGRRDGTLGPYVDNPPGPDHGCVQGYWMSGDSLNVLRITVYVTPSPESATEAAARYRLGCSAPSWPDPPSLRIGEQSWARSNPPYAHVHFVTGRVFAVLSLGPANRRTRPDEPWLVAPLDAFLEDVVRTLARGLEWTIRERPDMMAEADGTERRRVVASGTSVPSAPALTFRNVTWTSLSAFKGAGAKVSWDGKTGRAVASYGGRTIELTAFRREARLGGKKLDLGAAVMVGPDGPIVPLHKVAAALGIKVRTTKTTIRLG